MGSLRLEKPSLSPSCAWCPPCHHVQAFLGHVQRWRLPLGGRSVKVAARAGDREREGAVLSQPRGCGCGDETNAAFDAVGIVFTLFLPLSNWQLVLLCLF